ncbi:resolvase (plasmid) [Shewanella sp. LC6]|jgi:DNA invertase Pin-like site-specific DNA recombinase|nr:recombinase family protein [Shewanella sp. LC2]QQK62493.1 resolvase [Shewanella sp. LC6]TPE56179.1 resolvase [Shewanella sp. LC2]
MKVARIYMRVSADDQDLQRQERLISDAKAAGYYVAGVYREKASGARSDRPELLRMIADLQPDDVVIAEKLDRISRLPLLDAEKLIQSIKDKGAKLSIPGLVDLSELVDDASGVARIVLDSIQSLLLRLSLQAARDDYELRRERQAQGIEQAKMKGLYEGRKPNKQLHHFIIALRGAGDSISLTATKACCSEATVKRVWKEHVKTLKSLEAKELD